MNRIRIVAAIIAAAVCGAATAGEGPRLAEGSAAYRERVRLSDDGFLRLETRDATGAFYAAVRYQTLGRQTPLPFAIAAPLDGGALVAEIGRGEAIEWRGAPVAIPAGEGDFHVGALMLERDPRPAPPVRYVCAAAEMAIGFEGGEAATLILEEETIPLARAISGSGARYVARGDETTFVWLKGVSATVAVHGRDLGACEAVDFAPDFTAGATEPGWSLSFTGDRVALETEYGRIRREALALAPEDEAGVAVRHVPALGAAIRIADSICRDEAVGAPYPNSVVVDMWNGLLTGCGGDPLSLLTGGEWVVEDIAAGEVIDPARATLAFGPDGRVVGWASCNQYATEAVLTGEGISFGAAAVTRRACPEALMGQEHRFVDALSRVAGFDLDPTGALLLKDAEGAPLIRARRE